MSTKPNTNQITYDTGSNKQDLNNILDTVVPITDYTALRNYTGRAKQVRITADDIAGFFKYDPTDTTSIDNGGTIIVDASGRRWKRDYVGETMVDWFGAVGNGVTNDSFQIQTAVDWLSLIYLSTGKPQTLKFTDGRTYVMRLVYLRPGVNWIGGKGVVLVKTPAGDVTDENILNNWRMLTSPTSGFNTDAACAHRILIDGLIFDGNLANMNWTNNSHNQEQAHCLFMAGPSSPVNATHRTKFHVRNCHFQNSVADGLSLYVNSDLIAEKITADNCFRGGFVATGGNSKMVLRGYVGENSRVDFEVDGAGFGGSYRLDVDVDGVIVDRNGGGTRRGGIDFGGSVGGFFNMRNVQVFTPPFNFASSTGDPEKLIENCYFTVGELSDVANRFVRSSGTFNNCTFYVKETTGATSYAAIHVFPIDSTNTTLKFVRCNFILDPAIKANTPTAVCEVFRPNPSAVSTNPYNNGVLYRFEDCESAGAWDRDFYIIQGGTAEVKGGKYAGAITFTPVSTPGRPAQLTVIGEIELKSTVTQLFGQVNQAVQAGTFVQFQGVSLNRACQAGDDLFTYPIIGGYSFPTDAAPSSLGALRGAVARKNTGLTTTGQWGTIEWTATTSHASNSTWRATAFQVEKSTTANRPTLGTTDVGVMYLDTTLDAGGKPIWWTGTTWVDATGAVV